MFFQHIYRYINNEQINATWPEKCLQPGVTRCTLEHNHRLTGPLRAGRQDPVLPEELLAEHVSALKEWARIPVAVRTQVQYPMCDLQLFPYHCLLYMAIVLACCVAGRIFFFTRFVYKVMDDMLAPCLRFRNKILVQTASTQQAECGIRYLPTFTMPYFYCF